MPLHRLRAILATGALVAALALPLGAGPGSVESRTPAGIEPVDASLLQPVQALTREESPVAQSTFDPALRSRAALDADSQLVDAIGDGVAPSHVAIDLPDTNAGVIVIPTWRTDPEISWYGPGFYGNRTACGQVYSKTILGVAHKSLPCGTRVTFKHGSRVITVPVIDRGPYVAGRIFDLSRAACVALDHCYTGPIQYRFP